MTVSTLFVGVVPLRTPRTTRRPPAPVIRPSRVALLVAELVERLTGARLPVSVPASVTFVPSTRRPPLTSVPTSVLNTMSLITVRFATEAPNWARSVAVWPIVIAPRPKGLLTMAPGTPMFCARLVIQRRVPLLATLLPRSVMPPEKVLAWLPNRKLLLLPFARATATVRVGPSVISGRAFAPEKADTVSVEVPVPADVSVIRAVTPPVPRFVIVVLKPFKSKVPSLSVTVAPAAMPVAVPIWRVPPLTV
ncbi:MAG: hypothetical protein EBX35_07065 [Planctomycetia bacterium]|nr:hypothetical protein [Planctomycetia bacterium]